MNQLEAKQVLRAEFEVQQVQQLKPWHELFADELVKTGDIKTAAQKAGLSKQMAYDCFWNPHFCRLVQQKHYEEASRALASACDVRDMLYKLPNKTRQDRARLKRANEICLHLAEVQHHGCSDLWPGLKVYLGERWVNR